MKYLRYWCEAKDFIHLWDETWQNFLKYFRILQNLMRNYDILWKLMKATIFHCIFFIKSLTFVLFCSIAIHCWHFMILYHHKQFFSVCWHTVSPLGNIGKYFAIVKWKVIRQILQILTQCPKSLQVWKEERLIFAYLCPSVKPQVSTESKSPYHQTFYGRNLRISVIS
jgi:hypothetical protein